MVTILLILLLSSSFVSDVCGFHAQSRKQVDELSRRECLERISAVTASGATGSLWPQQARAAPTQGVPTVRLGKGSLEVSRTCQGYWQLAGKNATNSNRSVK